jgi:gamma-glutamylcyclotransferase (GGCT)/AIG2-like uncharacterized protein YtfP
LKRGHPNNYVLQNAEYLSTGKTKPKYSLYDLGDYPAAIAGGQTSISGEIYEIDQDILEELDYLEGYPELYTRKTILLDSGGKAIIYLLPKKNLPGEAVPILSGRYVGPPLGLSEGQGAALLFSYGSNHPGQLGHRLGRPVGGQAAYLPGYSRVFRGESSTWNGYGVASVKPDDKNNVYGYVELITKNELEIMDEYEGRQVGAYDPKVKTVMIREEGGQTTPRKAIVYVATSTYRNAPSREYLEAVVETISTFWSEEGGRKVEISDIPIQ